MPQLSILTSTRSAPAFFEQMQGLHQALLHADIGFANQLFVDTDAQAFDGPVEQSWVIGHRAR